VVREELEQRVERRIRAPRRHPPHQIHRRVHGASLCTCLPACRPVPAAPFGDPSPLLCCRCVVFLALPRVSLLAPLIQFPCFFFWTSLYVAPKLSVFSFIRAGVADPDTVSLCATVIFFSFLIHAFPPCQTVSSWFPQFFQHGRSPSAV
jgi:hypothetical protein